jgi:hypothetical protein
MLRRSALYRPPWAAAPLLHGLPFVAVFSFLFIPT